MKSLCLQSKSTGKKVVNLAIDILHNGDVWMASLWVSSHFVNSHFVNSQFVNSHLVNVDQVGNWQSGIDEVGVDKLGICGYLPLCQFKGTVVVVGRVSSSGEWPTYLDLFWRSQIQYCGVSPPVWLPTSLHPHSTILYLSPTVRFTLWYKRYTFLSSLLTSYDKQHPHHAFILVNTLWLQPSVC